MAEGLIRGACAFHSDKANTAGCLMVHGALVGSDDSASVRNETNRLRSDLRTRTAERLERSRHEDDLPKDADPAGLSGYLTTILRGRAVEAASGAWPDDLRRIVDVAMKAWPT